MLQVKKRRLRGVKEPRCLLLFILLSALLLPHLCHTSSSLEQSQFSLVQFSCSVISNSLWPHGLQHTRLPCPSLTPGACSNSRPSSQGCHPTISSSVIPVSSCLQSFPASGSFPLSQFFASGGQSIAVSASASVLPMNIQDWFPLGWTGWISLQSKRLSRIFSNTTVQKHQFFSPTILGCSHVMRYQIPTSKAQEQRPTSSYNRSKKKQVQLLQASNSQSLEDRKQFWCLSWGTFPDASPELSPHSCFISNSSNPTPGSHFGDFFWLAPLSSKDLGSSTGKECLLIGLCQE